MSLVFYDTETTGTNAAFDQILQFAAIRTDDDLKPLGSFEIRSRLLPYVIPAPGALRVTGLTIDDLLNEAHPSHFEMVSQLRATLAGWCPSVFIGYNSIRFDEEFLRQAFYQCLHPPYLTNTGGSKRADALSLVRSAVALYPDCMAVPLNEKGKRSFKLDQIAPANGFDHARAHDALADVEATIFLCALVKERCPDVWRRFLGFASKDAVGAFVQGADAFFLIDPLRQSSTPVVALGVLPSQANVSICWNLGVDPGPFAALSDEDLASILGKPGSPIRKMKKNAAPSLCPLDDAPEALFEGIDAALLAKRTRWLRQDRGFIARVLAALAANEVGYPPSPYVERQIYDGFWSHADTRRLATFHGAEWSERAGLIEQFEDARLIWLGRRLLWVERPDLCPSEHAGALEIEKAGRQLAQSKEGGGWNTIASASSDLASFMETASPEGLGPLVRLQTYLEQRRLACEAAIQTG